MLDTRRDHAKILPYLSAALRRAPDDHRLLTDAGSWLQQIGEPDAALALLEHAHAVQPDHAPAAIAMAAALADRGEIETGIALLRRLIAAGRGSGAAYANLGTMLSLRNDFAAADAAFLRARDLDRNHWTIVFNHGMALLKSGRLREGWPAFNMRLLLPGHALLPLRTLLPRLEAGRRLDGRTVLITHDSGFGDTLQFIRYAPMLAARGARVLLWAPTSLLRLLRGVPGIAAAFAENSPWPAHDYHCPIMRLPDVFETTLSDIPQAIPYLSAEPADIARWQAALPPHDGTVRVGLVFAGSARAGDPRLAAIDRRRSIDPALLAPLIAIPGLTWINLQKDRDIAPLTLHDPMPDVRDFADTAAIIENLDLVVSVDTAVAHLAGGLGKPVLLLDRYDNCWRWLAGRGDTPWYRGMRIFRQAAWGDWSVPLRMVGMILGEESGSFLQKGTKKLLP